MPITLATEVTYVPLDSDLKDLDRWEHEVATTGFIKQCTKADFTLTQLEVELSVQLLPNRRGPALESEPARVGPGETRFFSSTEKDTVTRTEMLVSGLQETFGSKTTFLTSTEIQSSSIAGKGTPVELTAASKFTATLSQELTTGLTRTIESTKGLTTVAETTQTRTVTHTAAPGQSLQITRYQVVRHIRIECRVRKLHRYALRTAFKKVKWIPAGQLSELRGSIKTWIFEDASPIWHADVYVADGEDSHAQSGDDDTRYVPQVESVPYILPPQYAKPTGHLRPAAATDDRKGILLALGDIFRKIAKDPERAIDQHKKKKRIEKDRARKALGAARLHPPKAAKKGGAKKAAKKAARKTGGANKSGVQTPVRKSGAKKTVHKSGVKKSGAKKSGAKKSGAIRRAVKKGGAKKGGAKKGGAKKGGAKKGGRKR